MATATSTRSRKPKPSTASLAVSLNRDVEIKEKDLGPDGSLEVALGNRWFVSEDDQWQIGVLGLLSYDNSWRNRERVERDIANPETLVENKLRTINQVSATGVVNLGLSYTSDHQISTSSFLLRNTEDESAISTRTNNNFQRADGRQLRDYDIRYEQRELRANQIRGHHAIGLDTRQNFGWLDKDWLDGLAFDWYVSEATAETDIPNEIKFSAEDTIDPATGDLIQTALRRSNSAADYRFTDLEDEVRSSGWDLMKAYAFENVDVEISGGQDVSDKTRGYSQTQFGLGTTALAAVPILVGTPTTVFTDANILNPLNGFELSAGRHRHGELSRGTDDRRRVLEGRRHGQRQVALLRRHTLGGFSPGFAADRLAAIQHRARPVRARALRRRGTRAHPVRRG